MSEWARFFWALLTAAALTWLGHWLSGALDYQLGWGWCALIGAVIALLVWYWSGLADLVASVIDAITDWGRW